MRVTADDDVANGQAAIRNRTDENGGLILGADSA